MQEMHIPFIRIPLKIPHLCHFKSYILNNVSIPNTNKKNFGLLKEKRACIISRDNLHSL